MQAIHDSFIYSLYCMLCRWCARQWENSAVVRWLTGQKPLAGGMLCRVGLRLRQIWIRWCQVLHLDRLLQGSIFLHPAAFAGAAVVLAPLCPTMVVLALVCASFFSLILRLGVEEAAVGGTSPLHGYVLLYAAVYLYATLTSTTVSGSLFPGLLTILFVLFFLVLTGSGLEEKGLRRLLWAMVAAGVLISCYGFYQRLFPARFRSVWTDEDMFSSIVFRVYSTLENPNVLGEYFLLVIPLGAAVALTAGSWRERIVGLGACGVMVVCLILTYSRGCYLGLLFAAAVFLVLLDRRFLIVGIVALALSPLYLPESVLTRFTSIGNMGDTSTSYRVYIWMGTLAMLKDYWLCGVGPGTDAYNVVYPEYAYNAITAPHSHNLYLQILCDTGICGLLVFLLLLVAYYRMMFTAIRRERDRTARVFQIAAVSAVTGFLVQSMTDFTFYNYRVLLLFWSVLALSVLFTRMGRTERTATPPEVAL